MFKKKKSPLSYKEDYTDDEEDEDEEETDDEEDSDDKEEPTLKKWKPVDGKPVEQEQPNTLKNKEEVLAMVSYHQARAFDLLNYFKTL